ncbi:MAG TPA: flagellar filament capping protein FliD [Bryocella sp.]|nr:flagellar filament capping protein FliD [Bryocella sp.]
MSTSSTGLSSLYGGAISTVIDNIENALSGKTAGINVSDTVDALMEVQEEPETLMQQQQSTIQSQVSALQSLQSQLSTVYDDLNNLTDLSGVFSQNTTGSSDPGTVSAAADNTAAAGTHTVTVQSLATTSSSYSGYIASGTSLAGQTITVDYGPDPSQPLKTDTINIPSDVTTLQDAVNDINSGGYGVTASIVSDSTGSRLLLVANQSGADNSLTVTDPNLSFTSTAGTDAQLTVDGVPVDSDSNTVTGAIPGVTLSLGATTTTPVTISVQPDVDSISTAIQSFVTDYNTLMSSINTQFTLNSSTGSEGVLAGDSMLTTLQSQLLDMMTSSVSGSGQYSNLQSLGIEMQDDGTLEIDSSTLSAALSSDFSDVQTFFQSAAPAGWGQQADAQMLQMTDPTDGPLSLDISGLNQESQDVTDQISDFQDQMNNVQQQLTTQYDNLNATLMQYPLLMQETATQLASLPGAPSTSSSNSSL